MYQQAFKEITILDLTFISERFINGSLQGFPWGGKYNNFYYKDSRCRPKI